jgi:pimeloyl-ACP methyl ester carboxylesterase
MASHDAIVVIPGIMGSELVDVTTAKPLWGLRDLSWYVRAWTSGSGLAALELTDDEREGRYGRVRPTGLLRFPAFARIFAGFEPYLRLVRAIRQEVVDPAAVLEFPYDWRLPVAYNGTRLASAIEQHIDGWLRHPAQINAQRRHPLRRPAEVFVVAHSMGGLLARCLPVDLPIRGTVTLGTPFYGSVKAAVLLNAGRGTPIPLPGVRRLARGLPGLHDLLPSYRCVDGGETASVLTPSDITAIGGDAELAEASQRMHVQLRQTTLPGHRAVVGVGQPTMTSIALRAGVVETYRHECRHVGDELRREDRAGDGTVYRDSAALPGSSVSYLPQQHGALARTDEAIALIRAVLSERDHEESGPSLGGGELGIEVPDVVLPEQEWPVTVTGVAAATAVTCVVSDASTGRPISRLNVLWRDGGAQAVASVPAPGLYRIEVGGSGESPATQLVLAADPTGDVDG